MTGLGIDYTGHEIGFGISGRINWTATATNPRERDAGKAVNKKWLGVFLYN